MYEASETWQTGAVFRVEASVLFHSMSLSLWNSIWFTWEMSPSSIFSSGSLSPFVFCPSKISRNRQNQVTVLSWELKNEPEPGQNSDSKPILRIGTRNCLEIIFWYPEHSLNSFIEFQDCFSYFISFQAEELAMLGHFVTWFLGFLWETSMNMELIMEWPNLEDKPSWFWSLTKQHAAGQGQISTRIPTWMPPRRSCWWCPAGPRPCTR